MVLLWDSLSYLRHFLNHPQNPPPADFAVFLRVSAISARCLFSYYNFVWFNCEVSLIYLRYFLRSSSKPAAACGFCGFPAGFRDFLDVFFQLLHFTVLLWDSLNYLRYFLRSSSKPATACGFCGFPAGFCDFLDVFIQLLHFMVYCRFP